MKKLFLLAIGMIMAVNLYATPAEFSVLFSNVAGDIDTDLGLGFKIGVREFNKLNDDLVIETTLGVAYKPTSYSERDFYYDDVFKIESSRISLEADSRIPIALTNTSYVFVGSYLGLNLFQSTKLTTDGYSEKYNDLYDFLDLGLTLGGGFVYNDLICNVMYQMGLLEIVDEINGRANAFVFSVTKEI